MRNTERQPSKTTSTTTSPFLQPQPTIITTVRMDVPNHVFACTRCGNLTFTSYDNAYNHFHFDPRHSSDISDLLRKFGTECIENGVCSMISAMVIPNEATIEYLKMVARQGDASKTVPGPAEIARPVTPLPSFQVGIFNDARVSIPPCRIPLTYLSVRCTSLSPSTPSYMLLHPNESSALPKPFVSNSATRPSSSYSLRGTIFASTSSAKSKRGLTCSPPSRSDMPRTGRKYVRRG